MPLIDDSIKILKYMLLLYMLFYILEKGRSLHEPSVLRNLLHVLLKMRRSKVLSNILSNIRARMMQYSSPFLYKSRTILSISPFPAVHIQVYIIIGGFC